MSKKKFKPGKLIEIVLNGIADFLLDLKAYYPRGSAYVILGTLIKYLIEKNKINQKKIERSLKLLEKRDIVSLKKKGKKVLVWINDNGKVFFVKYSLKKILEFKKKKKRWRKKWFLIFFDVPENQREKRDYLRRFLKFIGFYPYQKSVYIFPFDCKKEIALIKKIIEGGKYIKYIIADEIEEEEKFKKIFKLK